MSGDERDQLGANESDEQTEKEKQRRELVRSWLFEGLWFFLDLWFVWPVSHVWAVTLAALVIAIHLATSSNRVRTRIILCIALAALTASVVHFLPPNETETHGFLTPGNGRLPSGPCPASQDETGNVRIYFGGNEAIVAKGSTIWALSVSRHPVLEFRLTDKRLAVAGEIYSKTGEVAWLLNNEFWINPNLTFRSDHPNPHSLIVRDNAGTEILRIQYVNKTAVTFTGHLALPGTDDEIVITNTVLYGTSDNHVGHGGISGNCFDFSDSSGIFALIYVSSDGYAAVGKLLN